MRTTLAFDDSERMPVDGVVLAGSICVLFCFGALSSLLYNTPASQYVPDL